MAETDKPTSMYCLWNADREVIYVGITSVGMHRLAQHSEDKPWWSEVTNATFRHFDSRAEALVAERRTIKAYTPRYNTIHARVTKADRQLLRVQAKLDRKLEDLPQVLQQAMRHPRRGPRFSGPYKRPNVG